MNILWITIFICLGQVWCPGIDSAIEVEQMAAARVLERVIGGHNAELFHLEPIKREGSTDSYSIAAKDNRVVIKGTSQVALCRGAYDYLRNECGSIISWSGDRINIPKKLPNCTREVTSPFKYHYYLNVVTHGYTTPYWDWKRWERELDWMAMHGLDMPLIPGAHEAILFRTFKKIGLTEDEIMAYFSGPAHLPWNRMGNIGAWDGPLPKSFLDQQIDLTHKMLDRMTELGMHPIVQGFAGFVPPSLNRLYPQEDLRELGWGGFDKRVHILAPQSQLFAEIGETYVREWEKEFGKGEFYLADSFNEMDVPLSQDSTSALQELAAFGESVYQPIAKANPDAVWVMMGWTFPYHRDENGNLFWTPDRLEALISGIPDDRLMILDLANEYNSLFWKIDYSWKMYNGFFDKQWIYSFIPNMGGKVPLNGVLDYYATAPEEVLQYKNKKKLVGFGFAPEGIENNEVIYELLSDWGWRSDPIDLDAWLKMYCTARYGGFPEAMRKAWDLLRKSSLGSFTDHPRFRFQFRPWEPHQGTVHHSQTYKDALDAFLSAADDLGQSLLYVTDAIELAVQYFGLEVDQYLDEYLVDRANLKPYRKAMDLLTLIDRLLVSHPNHRLDRWVRQARSFGTSPEYADYFESNAKRLITTWGGGVNEYAARVWSGLVQDYYQKRWQLYVEEGMSKHEIQQWEEEWITTPWESANHPFEDPLEAIKKNVEKLSH